MLLGEALTAVEASNDPETLLRGHVLLCEASKCCTVAALHITLQPK